LKLFLYYINIFIFENLMIKNININIIINNLYMNNNLIKDIYDEEFILLLAGKLNQ